ncbi:DUF86 domain-containing protein [Sporosarcina pasteurii]|uniref:Uncharacterized conserved protein n=1 Tax=Sporosarcina pasteurii TaxID=1474 RepID=A0A380CA10_SPOPA|nr:DUF86 domain-containing protein [Sporosarcina pasteurii]MDS9472774.1 DUF86 domain-containing protein [Sporosarcina pasteurii]QBQ04426.1 DUF86 domain-containing protein [Sporosarcina pasteurii]SUJ15156.1 Uncharacterized conserved protein [Sporosarcina pasteurii]
MYFVDRNKIEKVLCHIEELLALYQKEENWHKDCIHSLALSRLSHDIIEGIIDVGNTMIDGFIMRDPGSYEDIIDIMDDEKVITADMTDRIKKVIELRQMIVREFISVDTNVITSTLNEAFEALQLFPEKVRHYLEHELGPVSAFLPADEEA